MHPEPAPHPRSRFRYLLLAVGVIVLGLASRRWPGLLPAGLGKYPGDALWTVLVFVLWGICLPRASSLRITLLALLTSYAVEFSQLCRAPWLDALRHTVPGHLVLGTTFAWPDLLAYTTGALLAFIVEAAGQNSKNRSMREDMVTLNDAIPRPPITLITPRLSRHAELGLGVPRMADNLNTMR